jgi:Xaa-Pro aminopeptidase
MSVDRHAERLARTMSAIGEAGLGGLLVTPGANLGYLTGYAPMPLERLTVLVLAAGRDPVMIVPMLERPSALASPAGEGIDILGWTDAENPYALTAGLLGGSDDRMAAGTFAISDDAWASHVLALERAAGDIELTPQGVALPLIRAVKDPDELQRLRAAAHGADAAFEEVVRLRFAGRRELDVAGDLARLLQDHGHELVGFTIVGSGPSSASPHHDSGDRTIQEGDAVVMDFGGVAGGYWSDITRTVFVGDPTDEQRHVYDLVRGAQEVAFATVRPGVACEEVDRAARAVIEEAGYGDRFIHRTGHGIGIELHEPPYIVAGYTTPLEAGMTFSDEPGIYLPNRFGVRIEDQIEVTHEGARRLNEASRELRIVA